jgi:hypothetical protein
MVNNEEVLGKFESYILQQLFEYLEELRELQQENNYSDVLFIFDEIPQVVAYVQAILQGNEVSVPDCLAQKGDAHLTREGIPYLVSARLAAYKRSLELYLKRIELETAPHEAKAKVSTMLKACERMLTEENWNSQHRFDTIKDYIRALEIHIDILNTTRVYEWEPGQIEQLFLRLNTKVARIFTGIRSRWSQKK